MKLNKSNLRKIDLEDIVLNHNVRIDYTNIKELAESIKRDGQIQPVVVSKNDNDEYVLNCGYRRFKAHQYLVDKGEPFNQIEAIVKTGDFEIIQLTENIQRENLTAIELENGLKKMIDRGMSQKDIASRLNKSPQWVSDHLAGGKVREIAESKGVDTSGLSSSVVQKLRNVDEKDIPAVLKEVKNNGGTVKVAKAVVQEREPVDVDPFKGLKKEVGKLKKDYSVEFILKMVGEMLG